ncbi:MULTISPECIES: DUF1801 domain-containing protein [unclassified Streptomyces]|uniref:DUF1801 domain-containing protein n=1 Tax=unclassified Streptomyces TaxID=2593676 RepID=UPI000CD4A738|nr:MULTISPECIES: DUF1801 domain-containing protein [unclassified Streptomyces]
MTPNAGKHSDQGADGFSDDERAAMRQRAAELDVLSKIAEMADSDRAVAERVHAIVTTHAPELAPKLWYGQPAYARKGKVVCFFRSGHADKERYSTLGFTAEANFDDDSGLWPTSYAVTELTEEARRAITALVRKAVS